ncbi:polysaccharide pyruvyl transferase family protein [Roseixanthobacter liquoris]|uniref:polysaccharide pyruvyl transferase family protein n=1 Tax=Roseixanthobacter liquoris TaxID=3119921 RepID=UPI00372658B1
MVEQSPQATVKKYGHKPRILVMIPAGKRYQHDNVMIYDQVRDDYIRSYFNTGDMMVYDSMLKLLDFHDMDVLKIANPTEADIDRYNRSFDYVILRGSNFIHEHMQWEKAEWVLNQIKIPVYAIGVGAQAETRRKISLPPESRKVWELIAERSVAVGVRGSYTAEVLNDNGIKNTEIVGCPSLFRNRDRNLGLRLRVPMDVKKVAFSLRRETSHYYAADMKSFVSTQRELLLRIASAYDTTVTIHGEPEEKAFFTGDAAAIARATETLRKNGWFTPEFEQRLTEIYGARLFLNDRVEDYDALIRTQDFAIGYRVHGILPALANGTPGVLVDYDSRSGELAETFSIPRAADKEVLARPFDEMFAQEQFNAFLSNFPANYDQFKGYLDNAGIPNRM